MCVHVCVRVCACDVAEGCCLGYDVYMYVGRNVSHCVPNDFAKDTHALISRNPAPHDFTKPSQVVNFESLIVSIDHTAMGLRAHAVCFGNDMGTHCSANVDL